MGRGAAAGTAATVVMSAVMLEARKAGLLGRMPPRTIVGKMLGRAGVRPRGADATNAVATLGHFAFGAGSGALYGAFRPAATPGGALVRGALYGAGIWAVSYAGWIPALGLLPPPNRDRPGRPTSMFIAHLVFGATLGALASRRQEPRR